MLLNVKAHLKVLFPWQLHTRASFFVARDTASCFRELFNASLAPFGVARVMCMTAHTVSASCFCHQHPLLGATDTCASTDASAPDTCSNTGTAHTLLANRKPLFCTKLLWLQPHSSALHSYVCDYQITKIANLRQLSSPALPVFVRQCLCNFCLVMVHSFQMPGQFQLWFFTIDTVIFLVP